MGVVVLSITFLASGAFWLLGKPMLSGVLFGMAIGLVFLLVGWWHVRRAARPGAKPLGPRFMMLLPGLMAIMATERLLESLDPPRPRALVDSVFLAAMIAQLVWLYRLHRTRQREQDRHVA